MTKKYQTGTIHIIALWLKYFAKKFQLFPLVEKLQSWQKLLIEGQTTFKVPNITCCLIKYGCFNSKHLKQSFLNSCKDFLFGFKGTSTQIWSYCAKYNYFSQNKRCSNFFNTSSKEGSVRWSQMVQVSASLSRDHGFETFLGHNNVSLYTCTGNIVLEAEL